MCIGHRQVAAYPKCARICWNTLFFGKYVLHVLCSWLLRRKFLFKFSFGRATFTYVVFIYSCFIQILICLSLSVFVSVVYISISLIQARSVRENPMTYNFILL